MSGIDHEMHSVILLGDEILTLDTEADRIEAARLMASAGILSLPVYRGGPETDLVPEGRDFCVTSDGRNWRWSY